MEVLIPGVMAPVSATFADLECVSYVETVAFVATSIVTTIVTFFNYAGQTERHFAFAARYDDLVTDVDGDLLNPQYFILLNEQVPWLDGRFEGDLGEGGWRGLMRGRRFCGSAALHSDALFEGEDHLVHLIGIRESALLLKLEVEG
mgnify:CR=1 FL=1